MASRLDYITDNIERTIKSCQLLNTQGRVLEVTGAMIKASIQGVKVGELCELHSANDDMTRMAEVVGFHQGVALLTPLGPTVGLSNFAGVASQGKVHEVPVGYEMLGTVVDGLGNPMGRPNARRTSLTYPVYAAPPNPMERRVIDRPLAMGLRVFDGLLTCGEGQRMGIFAAAGGGKSTLLSMLIRNSEADVTVLALIGERGREVREFIEHDIGEAGMKKSVVVVATSERPAMERLKAAYVATAIAEYFRDRGERVLLMMDSVTRFARAQREIGLAAGEPPTRRGFPPSVFTALPQLMERAGQSAKGSITGLYTVLVEGDDMTEPVADETRSILDGHIILSRKLAQANHYPAIDVLESVSRVMNNIVDDNHKRLAGRLRELLARYRETELLINIGEYKRGSNADVDEAIDKMDRINALLRQGLFEVSQFSETLDQMRAIVDG